MSHLLTGGKYSMSKDIVPLISSQNAIVHICHAIKIIVLRGLQRTDQPRRASRDSGSPPSDHPEAEIIAWLPSSALLVPHDLLPSAGARVSRAESFARRRRREVRCQSALKPRGQVVSSD